MSNKNSIRSIPPVEVASSSDTNAPVFYFNQYNQSQEYFNNRERIDFVTYEGSLYVPGAERVVPQTNDITRENFVLLVSRGPQGLPGVKGDPGRDGRTPSVFARFDGKQMIFYTNELNEDGTQKINERTGEPVIKRIAATNDLTGPSWRPKRVDDTIIWEKTRDDSQPESINLSDFVKETAPVIFRVDSDNTKRTDETSGPANYIQWKYEGDEYWNNLISISELMNLALAGVCIWFDEDDQEYHLGHREVLHATYDSSKTKKRIISKVEHGDVLYDAGPIKFPEEVSHLALKVQFLETEVCELKKSIPKIRLREDKMLQVSYNGGVSWQDLGYTCECSLTPSYILTVGNPTPSDAVVTVGGKTVDTPYTETVKSGSTVCIEATATGYKPYNKCVTITDNNVAVTPKLEPVSSDITLIVNPKTLSFGSNGGNKTFTVITNADSYNIEENCEWITYTYSDNIVTINAEANSGSERTCTVTISAGDKTAEITINQSAKVEIPDATVKFTWEPGEVNAKFIVNEMPTSNHTFTIQGGETITWKVTAEGYTATENGEGSWTNDGSTTYKIINIKFKEDSVEPTYTVDTSLNKGTCSVGPDNIYLSTTNDFSEQNTSISNLTGTNTIYAQAVKSGKEPITNSIEVNGAKTIKFSDITTGCPWDKEPTTTYTVTATAASCDPTVRVVGVSESENGPFEPNLPVNKGESPTIFAKATRTGHEDNVISQQVSESDPTILIPCDGWTKKKYTLTINSSNAPDGYSIKVGTDVVTLTNNTWKKQYEYGTEIVITAEASGYTSTINLNNFKMTKNTSVNITWTSEDQTIHVTGVSLNEESIILNKSCDPEQTSTFTLTATVEPSNATDNTVTWSKGSSNAVNIEPNGLSCTVTPVNAGTATITCTTTDGRKTDNCNVTVTENTAITGITLNKTTTTLTVGGTETLSVDSWKPSCASKPTVTWSITPKDGSIATVDDTGKVDAKAPGKATITAEVNGKTATCEVTVNAAPVTTYHIDVKWISGCEPDSYYVTTDKSSSAREEEIDAPEGSTVYLIANKRGYVQYETSVKNISSPYTFEPPCSIWASVTINNCIGNDMSTSDDSAEHVRNLYARIDNVDASNDNIEWRVEPVGNTPGNAIVEPNTDDAGKDCGRVTALGAGIVKVFAKSKRNGNEGSCVINIVEEDPIMVSAVTIDPLNMNISVSDTSTSRLRAIVSGTGNYNKAVTWNVTKDGASTDGLTLTPGSLDESGNYTAEIKGNVAGQYTVRAISVQDTNISGQCTIMVLGETKNVRLINNSPWTVNYSVGNTSSTIATTETKELGTVSEDMTIQRVYPDKAKTYFTLENGTNTYSQSGNKSNSYSGNNWIISYADLQSGDIIIDYETGIGPILP